MLLIVVMTAEEAAAAIMIAITEGAVIIIILMKDLLPMENDTMIGMRIAPADMIALTIKTTRDLCLLHLAEIMVAEPSQPMMIWILRQVIPTKVLRLVTSEDFFNKYQSLAFQ